MEPNLDWATQSAGQELGGKNWGGELFAYIYCH
jgi:hypothetical protein